MVLTGPDVSHHQGAVDWRRVASAGHSFAWCKASEGRSFRDSQFTSNWAGIRFAGMVRGAYHFLRSDADPATQARHFVSVAGDLRGSLAAVDVETSGTSRPSGAQARAFVAEFRRLTARHPIVVYTGRWYWRDTIGNPGGADLGPLWHSAYSTSPGPLYGGWPRFTFWQWTQTGTAPGIAGRCDLNRFYGDRTALRALTGIPEVDVTPQDHAKIKAAVRGEVQRLGQYLAAGQGNQAFNPRLQTWMRRAVTMPRLAAAIQGVDDELDVEAIEDALRGSVASEIAAAIPDELAQDVLEALTARLDGEEPAPVP
jgi:lysozyme